MFYKVVQFIFLISVIFAASVLAHAQSDADASERSPGSRPRQEPTKNVLEMLAKQRIEREKKDYAELLTRGQEAVRISTELEKSYEQNNNLSAEDLKKLALLEKDFKKIRTELGGEDEDEDVENKSLSIGNALKTLKTDTVKLVDELKKTTRYSVSVIAVESSNALLSIVRFLRLRK